MASSHPQLGIKKCSVYRAKKAKKPRITKPKLPPTTLSAAFVLLVLVDDAFAALAEADPAAAVEAAVALDADVLAATEDAPPVVEAAEVADAEPAAVVLVALAVDMMTAVVSPAAAEATQEPATLFLGL
jgi:hypothetical protein